MKTDELIKISTSLCAGSSILVVFLIFGYTFLEGLPVLIKYGPSFLTGLYWKPYADPPQFGLLPTIVGTLSVSGLAISMATPIGVLAAIYLAEYSGVGFLKSLIESATQLLVSVPSVVLGFIGLVFLVPTLAKTFGGWGFSILAGGIVLAIMTLPHIICISSDAIKAVPREYRYASLALGASRWQTIRRVVLPVAKSGILASIILGLGNAIGETMAVLMVIGNPEVPYIPTSILDRVRVLTSTIVIEFNYAVWGSDQMRALFAIGVTLFIITAVVNLLAFYILGGRIYAKKA